MSREYILEEIRRTAEANGGVPLGWRKFLSETGVKESEWLGRHWARWSDALREAGFPPNEFKVAYEDSDLLERFAIFVQELGRLPTDGDLRLKANSDPDFPSDRPFRRFGTKAEIVNKLREFCRGNEGYQDVSELCEGYAPRSRKRVEESDEGEIAFGCVYLLKSGRYNKIGKSNSFGRREYELGIQLPERASTVHVIRTDDPTGIETYWHRRFAAKRRNGEWFELDAADVVAFKRRKSFM